ncbi:MAG: hopanoid biosynthesis-associated protein HpnK [Candidatus Binatia bacterium]|nr:hopanoid biosynthesis-associated protein HpnK [Candidatus Binatia bacterium]
MGEPHRHQRQRRLIVSADDFGLSPGVNRGIVQAHEQGLLTNTSLMVNGAAVAEAVELARAHPRLGVGLHLVLLQGYSTLPPQQIPGLVDSRGEFSRQPVRTGLRYFFVRALHAQLEREIRAQVEKFLATGLRLTHVDGHLNIHMHPTVLQILVRIAPEYGIVALRLPREPLGVTLRASWWQWCRKIAEAVTFRALTAHARPRLDGAGLRYPDWMFGLHQSGRMTEPYLAAILRRLPPGTTEVYTHASFVDEEAKHWRPRHYDCEGELRALISPRLRALIEAAGIELISYAQLRD